MKINLNNIAEESLDDAEKIMSKSDKELMAKTLESLDQEVISTCQMAMILKLKGTISTLNNNIKKLNKSTKISSWIMGALTSLILILTAILVWKEIMIPL